MAVSIERSKIALMHIPKTGGTALSDLVHIQTRSDPLLFYSFFGRDASEGANRVVVESLQAESVQHQTVLASPHFLASRVVSGHFSYHLRELFAEFSFQFAAILREPIARCLSTIYQYSNEGKHGCRFGFYEVSSKVRRPEAYWEEIYWILKRHEGQPIPGLLPHESMMLANGMCHMIGGTPLDRYRPDPPFISALEHLPAFKLALFDRFNETCAAMLAGLGLPISIDANTNPRGEGSPVRATTPGPNFGAPPKMVELARAWNQDDLRLYDAALARFSAPTG